MLSPQTEDIQIDWHPCSAARSNIVTEVGDNTTIPTPAVARTTKHCSVSFSDLPLYMLEDQFKQFVTVGFPARGVHAAWAQAPHTRYGSDNGERKLPRTTQRGHMRPPCGSWDPSVAIPAARNSLFPPPV